MESNRKSSTTSQEEIDMDFPDIQCNICNTKFSSSIPYQSHIEGRKHRKKLLKIRTEKKLAKMHLNDEVPEQNDGDHDDQSSDDDSLPFSKPYGKCDLCKKTFFGPESKHQHFVSTAHKKKVVQEKVKNDVVVKKINPRDHITINENTEDDILQNYAKCQLCEKTFNNAISLTQHLESSAHQRKVRELQREGDKDMEPYSVDPDTSMGYKFKCKNCDVSFRDIITLQQHLASQSHTKQKHKKDILEFLSKYPELKRVSNDNVIVTDSTDGTSGGEQQYYPLDSDSDFFVCKICSCSFSGPESARDHMLSRGHAKARQKKLVQQNLADSETVDEDAVSPSTSRAGAVINGSGFPPSSGKSGKLRAARLSNSSHVDDDFEVVF